MNSQVNINIIQYIAMIGSCGLLGFIIYLVRKKRIKENYSLLWIVLCLFFILFSFWRSGLDLLAHMIGIAYAPSAFLLLLVMAIFLILIQFSIVISQLSEKNKRLIQEMALLELEVRQLKGELKKRS